MPSPSTKTGTRKLSEVARHLIVPAGITHSGWPQVEKRCAEMGIGFDEWQRGTGRLILAKTKDGKYAATVGGVGLSLPRQVGKTYLIGAIVFALCIDNPGLTVIWTAHHSRTAGETFLAMQGMARRRRIAPYVGKVYTAANSEEVRFVNGSRILFGARERGFGRGFAGVDILVCDEGQILTDRALDNMLATMNTAPNALPLFMGTPPTPADPSESFERMRADALSGESDDVAWIECGAPPGVDPDDRKAWAQANPSYPHRTPVASMLRLRKKLKPASWLREGLGIWDDDSLNPGILPRWSLIGSDAPAKRKPVALGIAANLAGTHITLGAASGGKRRHLRVVMRVPFEEQARLVRKAVRLQERHGCPIAVDEKGPAATLVDALEDEGANVDVYGLTELIQACADIKTAVVDGTVWHSNDPLLNDQVRDATWRKVGDRLVFGRKAVDIDALESVTWANYAAEINAYDVLDSIG